MSEQFTVMTRVGNLTFPTVLKAYLRLWSNFLLKNRCISMIFQSTTYYIIIYHAQILFLFHNYNLYVIMHIWAVIVLFYTCQMPIL